MAAMSGGLSGAITCGNALEELRGGSADWRRSATAAAQLMRRRHAACLNDDLLFSPGELKIGLLQSQASLTGLFVLRLCRQIGARGSPSHQEFCAR